MYMMMQKLKLSKLQKQQISNWRTSVHSEMQLLQRQRHTVISQVRPSLSGYLEAACVGHVCSS